jgi:hypothetical protein
MRAPENAPVLPKMLPDTVRPVVEALVVRSMEVKVPDAVVKTRLVAVAFVVMISANVFTPKNVCDDVDMNPRAVEDASGMLNVCVLTEDTMLKSVPELPIAKL